MGALCLSTSDVEALVLDSSDGPIVLIASRGCRRRAAIEWRIVAPPAVGVVRGKAIGMVAVNEAIVEVQALQRDAGDDCLCRRREGLR
ncbi:MAG: hypothetical protein SGJ19_20410 [Planctomycetia bacterium]|nr:hypothetical protein [Planctomycetia bacterium]